MSTAEGMASEHLEFGATSTKVKRYSSNIRDIRRKCAGASPAKMPNTSYIRSNIREYEVVGNRLYLKQILKISCSGQRVSPKT